jgi:signal transduction histidine kinase
MPLLQPVASLRQAGTREEVYTELLTATCSLLETHDAALLTSFDDKPYEVAALQGTRLEALATAGNPYDWLPTREGAEEIRVGRGLDEARIPAGLTGSWLVTAPLARRSEVQSLVVAAAAGRPTPSELEALRLVCAHAAVSLDNLELLSELRRAYDGAHELEQLKSDFINITGHELRTPLAVVIGFANILQDRLDGELKEYAKQVVAHAERLKQISDDMLNLKLLQVGEADLQIEPCRVDEIVQNVVAAYRSLAEDRNQSVEVHIADRVGQIPADRNMLALMVGALLSNAIKFSARGTCIRVSADGDSHQIILQVQDQGKGLEQDQSAHIFDAFYRTDNSLARSEGGLGLGLTLTREMVKAHGGEIWVKSEKNRGSTFYISLPRESLVGRAADRHTST